MNNGIEHKDLTFVDMNGNTWDLKINMAIALVVDKSDFSVLSDLEFSFIEPGKEFLQEVYANVPFSMALIWAIVQGDQVETNLVKPAALAIHSDSPDKTHESLLAITAALKNDETIDWELEFIKLIDGDVLQAARKSLMQALADFFPLHRIALLQFINQIDKMTQMTNLQMNSILPELGEHMEKEVTQACKRMRKGMQEGRSLSEILGEESINQSSS